MVETPTADSPAEPDISHLNPAAQKTWFGHPRQLARLFTTEMWERFGYYGMRALLTLYLTKHFIFGDRASTGLYGGYTALVYLTPLIGGFLADQYLGSKRSVKFGAILMAIGYFTLAFGGTPSHPYAVIDGQRYEVQVDNFKDRPTSDPNEKRFLIDHGQKLQIKGNEDGSVSLLAPDGHVARTVAKGGLESKSDQNPLMVTVLLIALSLISVGNGFFKPNISTMVGALYEQGDRRRDTGFTIFYMGINLGSILGQAICPILADWLGWWAGLGCAGVGMLISYLLIQFDGGRLSGYGEPPERAGSDRALLIYALAIVAVPVVYFLFTNLMSTPAPVPGAGFVGYLLSLSLMAKLLFGTFLLSVPGILIWSYTSGSRTEFQMMVAAMVLITFNVVFWTLFEQAGSSLTLFADRNTDRSVFGWFDLSAPQTQNFNPICIVLFAPVMSVLWTWLAKREVTAKPGLRIVGFVWTALLALVALLLDWLIFRTLNGAGHAAVAIVIGALLLAVIAASIWAWFRQVGSWTEATSLEPSIPVKFGIALIGVGAGFLFLVWGTNFAGADFKVGLWWLAGLYLIHSLAELCISPVGLSMITKLSIARIVGLMMGVWFLSISCAQYVAGVVAQIASVETVGGQVTNLQVSLNTYVGVFWKIGFIAAGIGLFLLVLSPLIKKWMHGVQ
ncbi:MAG TPA: peptide MFS transporter [Allosphingosinicella sp.]|jgi:POT family proton-dependent oligopeptide transporter